MADLTVTGARREGSSIIVDGTGFTKTTTYVEIDGNQVAFEIPAEVTDGSRLTIADAPEGDVEIDVTKGDVTQSVSVSGQSTAGSSTGGAAGASFPEQGSADVSTEELATAANAGAPVKTPQNPEAAPLGTYESQAHLEGANVNETVAQTKLDRIEEEYGIGPRDPYPTGNPPDPAASRQRMGLPPVEEGEVKDQLDADPAT